MLFGEVTSFVFVYCKQSLVLETQIGFVMASVRTPDCAAANMCIPVENNVRGSRPDKSKIFLMHDLYYKSWW